MTLANLFIEFLDVYEKKQSLHEIKNKKNRFVNHINPVLGNMLISDIKFKDCQKLANSLIYDKELNPKTAKNILMIVSACFNFAIKNDYVSKNPVKFVDFGNVNNKYDLEINSNDIARLFENIFNFTPGVHRDIFILALHGRRKSEILSFQWFQVDLVNQIYFIPANKSKNHKLESFKMTNTLFSMFKKRFIESKKIGLNKKDDFVFVNERSLTRYFDISKPFIKLKKLSKIKKFRFHDFRHLLATTAINKKVPIEFISQTLGHSSIEVTQKYITKNNEISKTVCDVFLSDFLKSDSNF